MSNYKCTTFKIFASDKLAFFFFKSYLLHSRPNSMIGSPGYIALEVLSCKEYDGKVIIYILSKDSIFYGIRVSVFSSQ